MLNAKECSHDGWPAELEDFMGMHSGRALILHHMGLELQLSCDAGRNAYVGVCLSHGITNTVLAKMMWGSEASEYAHQHPSTY